MATPITASYVRDGDSWLVTVDGAGERRTASAPGIIAARDQADQLVAKASGGEPTTVVHLLNGSAIEFTTEYLHARMHTGGGAHRVPPQRVRR